MSFWNGAFSKHRDFQHPNFYRHLIANSVDMPLCREPLWCDVDPITGEDLQRDKRYYLLAVTLTAGSYIYLIPEHRGGGEPDDKDIEVAMEKYIKFVPPRGRDINWYIDFERGINTEILKFMRDNGLGDKLDFRWTDNETFSSAARP